ncbi:MAG: ABC transporter ATP-binding protein [Rhodothermia bacterium]|nr:ABC transporter ATP-binding protein [Rhodothermia bacterium]
MIVVENLTKRFDGKIVLNNVSLEIHEGETFAIIGRSGSGKSVLMKHVIGLMKPDEGRVWIDDVDINKVSYKELRNVRQKFGVLFQGGALFDSMNAFDNVAFPLRMFTRMREAEIEDRVNECLSVVSLPDAGKKRISELSGGMQKRVACARAIALKPKYVFYDEPNSGLDPLTSGTINDLIATLSKKERVTGIVVTHDMHSVLKIADRAAFIHQGNLHWLGTVEDLHRSTDATLLAFVKASEYKIGH